MFLVNIMLVSRPLRSFNEPVMLTLTTYEPLWGVQVCIST